jgi:hypothetical protein
MPYRLCLECRFIANDDESSPTHSLALRWAFRFVISDRWGTQDAEFDAVFAQIVRANDPVVGLLEDFAR